MRKSLIATLAILCCAAAGAQDAAQPPGQGKVEEIVVTGRPHDKQIREFVKALTPVPEWKGQIRQFVWAVCPGAVGLEDVQNAKVVRRMRHVAAEAGIPLAKETCRPNVIVIVTDAKDALIADLDKRNPMLFETMTKRERKALVDDSGPAAALHAETWIRSNATMSLLNPPIRRLLAAAYVIVDLKALEGLSIRQLADYAALRGFAQTDPARAAATGMPTILTLFEDRAAGRAQSGLSEWDLFFLKALYSTSNDTRGSYQRAWMADQVRKELKRKHLQDGGKLEK